jgi:hypothetical protein
MFNAKMRGVKKLLKKLEQIGKDAPKVLGGALYQEGLAIDALATERTPVDTGRLRATHYVTPPQKTDTGTGRVVEVGFATDYAVYVHEMTGSNHTTGQAKYLESAMKERTPEFLPRLARRALQNLKKGVEFKPQSGAPRRPNDKGEEWQDGEREKTKRRQAKKRERDEKSRAKRAKKADKEATRERKKAERATKKRTRELAKDRKARERRAKKRLRELKKAVKKRAKPKRRKRKSRKKRK